MNLTVIVPHNISSDNNSIGKELNGFVFERDSGDLSEGLFRFHLFRVLYGIFLNLIIVAGLVGNILTFIILTRKAIRSSTTSVYLRLLAVADSVVLFTAIFRYKTYTIVTDACSFSTTFYLDPYVEVYIEPLHWISLGVSSFTTLALSIERYLAVKFPLAIKHTSALSIVRVVMGFIMMAVVALTIPNIVAYTVEHAEFQNISIVIPMKTAFGRSSEYMCQYHEYIIPIGWYLLPCCILTTLNFLLCLKVRQSAKLRLGHARNNRNRNLTVLVILVILVYILCNLPRCVLVFYRLVHYKAFCEQTKIYFASTPRSYLMADLFSSVSNVLNSCLNIFIYCIVGKQFRNELKKLLLCHRWRIRAKVFPALPTIAQAHTTYIT